MINIIKPKVKIRGDRSAKSTGARTRQKVVQTMFQYPGGATVPQEYWKPTLCD